MIIGHFKENKHNAIVGDLPSLGFKEVVLEPIEKKGTGPDYRVHIEGAEIGAAWKKRGKNGEFITATIDAPHFSAPAFVTLNKKENGYVVSWKRPTTPRTLEE